jgi:DivIVA domain-containing protein
MELTAKTLQEVTFGAKVRGYDPAEVDDFIAAVAEGVEELHERLRRATERATRAEQQLAAAPVDVPSVVPQIEPAPTGNTEISKVWERAVAAAEEAVNEAKAEAQRLLDEARNRADTQLNDARREAETTVSTAKSEAARITEESQAQLRIEIQKLESARDSLNTDVAGLNTFLENEKDRIKARLNEALGAIEQYGSGATAPLAEPASSSYVSDVAPVTTTTDDWAAPTTTATSVAEPAWNGEQSWNNATPSEEASEAVVEDANPQESGEPDVPFNWMEPQPEASADDWQDETAVVVAESTESESESNETVDDAEADGDPFLAELRRAVQDDGPLGPRDDESEDPLNDLYSSDDDTNGFFRRNK